MARILTLPKEFYSQAKYDCVVHIMTMYTCVTYARDTDPRSRFDFTFTTFTFWKLQTPSTYIMDIPGF